MRCQVLSDTSLIRMRLLTGASTRLADESPLQIAVSDLQSTGALGSRWSNGQTAGSTRASANKSGTENRVRHPARTSGAIDSTSRLSRKDQGVDSQRFDELAKAVANSVSRRGIFRGVAGVLLGGTLGARAVRQA